MAVFIFVSNINTIKDVNRVKTELDRVKDISSWTVDLTDEEKVLRVVTAKLQRFEVINYIRGCGYECCNMDW